MSAPAAHNTAHVPPTSDEAPAADTARGFRDQEPNDSAHFAERQRVSQADKRIQTLKAAYALAGHELHIVDDGRGGAEFIASRWGLQKTLRTLVDVEQHLLRIGGRA